MPRAYAWYNCANSPVDAFISRLYIAHGLMLHNRTAKYRFRVRFITVLTLLALELAPAFAQSSKRATLNASSRQDLSVLDSILKDAVQHDEIPGAVLLVSHRGRVVYRKAIGYRALVPRREPM